MNFLVFDRANQKATAYFGARKLNNGHQHAHGTSTSHRRRALHARHARRQRFIQRHSFGLVGLRRCFDLDRRVRQHQRTSACPRPRQHRPGRPADRGPATAEPVHRDGQGPDIEPAVPTHSRDPQRRPDRQGIRLHLHRGGGTVGGGTLRVLHGRRCHRCGSRAAGMADRRDRRDPRG